ncbi:MAG: carbohydrate ABC transporter permease, partial [Clostridia bacterium]|nr:carbohydrate ABC transporter permease [Clostridia bacterium]
MKSIFEKTINIKKNPASLKAKTTSFGLKLFLYLFLIGIAYVCLFPFLYMLITSIKTSKDLSDITVNWVPKSLKLDNYRIAAASLDYFQSLKNTLSIVVLADIGHVLSCSAAGYALARYRFRGQKGLFLLVIVGIVIPVQALVVPTYMIFSGLKMLNSLQ